MTIPLCLDETAIDEYMLELRESDYETYARMLHDYIEFKRQKGEQPCPTVALPAVVTLARSAVSGNV